MSAGIHPGSVEEIEGHVRRLRAGLRRFAAASDDGWRIALGDLYDQPSPRLGGVMVLSSLLRAGRTSRAAAIWPRIRDRELTELMGVGPEAQVLPSWSAAAATADQTQEDRIEPVLGHRPGSRGTGWEGAGSEDAACEGAGFEGAASRCGQRKPTPPRHSWTTPTWTRSWPASDATRSTTCSPRWTG